MDGLGFNRNHRSLSFASLAVLASQALFCTSKGSGQGLPTGSAVASSVSPDGPKASSSTIGPAAPAQSMPLANSASNTGIASAVSSGSPATGSSFPSSSARPTNPSSSAGGNASDAGSVPALASSGVTTEPCASPALVWHSARKTNYTSYPDPGSEECIKYNGCTWAGQFAACDSKRPEAWVKAHNIAAAFPDFKTLRLHDLCLRKGNKTLVVTVLDACADSDCDGCCTENRGSSEQLIDLESYTDQRWGVPDGLIEWADLGLTAGSGCAD
jgi:hypothetical protein